MLSFDIKMKISKKISEHGFIKITELKLQIISRTFNGWLVGCKLKANCPPLGPGPIGGVPLVGVFLWDPSKYLHEFPHSMAEE